MPSTFPSQNLTIFDYLENLASLYNFLLKSMQQTLTRQYPQFLNLLPEPFNYNSEIPIPTSAAMRSIESILEMLYSCSDAMARIYNDTEDEALQTWIVEAHDELCLKLDYKAMRLHQKFKTHPPKLGFLIDDCFIPGGFEETNPVIEYILLHFFASALQLYQQQRAPILITFRDEAHGHGAIFDHRTIQLITGNQTVISVPASRLFRTGLSEMAQGLDTKYNPNILRGFERTHKGRTMPHSVGFDPNDFGLMIVPGYSSRTPENRPHVHRARMEHETNLIRKANNLQKPTLAICGGMWTLILALGGRIANLPELRKRAHTSRMPQLNQAGAVIGNDMAHDVSIRPNSELAMITQLKIMAVTSVHWAHAVRIPRSLIITSKAAQRANANDPAGCVYHNEIESVESVTGRLMGVQFHPEAAPNSHPDGPANHAVVRHMDDKGQSDFERRQLLREIRATGSGLFIEVRTTTRPPQNMAAAIRRKQTSYGR